MPNKTIFTKRLRNSAKQLDMIQPIIGKLVILLFFLNYIGFNFKIFRLYGNRSYCNDKINNFQE